jgi:cytochrome c peroxidase
MRPRTHLVVAAVLVLAAAALSQEPMHRGPHKGMRHGGMRGEGMHLGMFRALPEAFHSSKNPITPEKVELGRMLFFEKRLSAGRNVSCNSCHDLATFGVDNARVSTGHRGQRGNRNSPTVYNAAGQFVQFWDGRAADVEEQAKGPVLNPVEMAMPSAESVAAALQAIPGYHPLFARAFPGEENPVSFDNMARAIAAFERTLVTPSRWDRYLKGETAALSAAEKSGFEAFHDNGCVHCHAGVLIGGASYAELGAARPWADTRDPGRQGVTGQQRDRMVFKVPSLRNVEKTAPYFHDGSVATLEEAVRAMAKHQVGSDIESGEAARIVAWLRSLTGELPPGERIRKPALPPDAHIPGAE